MKTLTEAKPISDFAIRGVHGDAKKRMADMKPFSNFEVFSPLSIQPYFHQCYVIMDTLFIGRNRKQT